MSWYPRCYPTAWRIVAALLLALLAVDGAAPAVTARMPGSWPSQWGPGAHGAGPQAARGTPTPESGRLVSAYAQPVLPAAQPRQGPVPFLTVLCKFADVADEPQPPAFFRRLLGDSYPGLDDYWRAVSYGAISLAGSRVLGWYKLPQGRAAYAVKAAAGRPGAAAADLQRLAEDCTAAIDAPLDWSRYAGLNLAFNADLDLPHGGQVCLRRAQAERCYAATWLWPASLVNQATWAHEMGHALGLRHSSLDLRATYDNPWDVMSDMGICAADPEYGRIAQDPIAIDKDLLGWIPAWRKFVAAPASESTITLQGLSEPGPDGYLLAEIPIPGADLPAGDPLTHFYTVEARRLAGYDRNLPGAAVVIHEVDLRRETPARLVPYQVGDAPRSGDTVAPSATWLPGSQFRDSENGIAVAVEQATPTGFVVTITTQRRPWPLTPANHALVPAGEVSLTWEPVPGVSRFELQLWATGGEGIGVPLTYTAQAASRRVLLPTGTYAWRVRALSEHGPGPWTPPRSLMTGRLEPAGQTGATADLPPAGAGRALTAGDGHGGAYAVWVGPGAGGPNIAALGPLGGLQTDIYAAYRPAGSDWGPVAKINDDLGALHGSLSLATDPVGNAYAIWSASNPGKDEAVYAAYRAYGGTSWSQSSRISDDHSLSAHGLTALAVDEHGNAYATWIDGRAGGPGLYFAYRPHALAGTAGGWSANTRVSSDAVSSLAPPSVVVDVEGNAYVAWRQDRGCRGAELMFAGRTVAGTWGRLMGIPGEATSQWPNWPRLALDGRGTLYAVWQEDGVHGALYAARCALHCGLPGGDAASWGGAARLSQAVSLGDLPNWRLELAEGGDPCLAEAVNEDFAGRGACLALDALSALAQPAKSD